VYINNCWKLFSILLCHLLLYSSQFVLFQKQLATLPAAIQLTGCTVRKATPHTACCCTAHSLYCSKSHSSHCLLLYSSQVVLFEKPLLTLHAAVQLTVYNVPKPTPHTAFSYTAHRLYCSKSQSSNCLLLYSSQFSLFQKPLTTLPAAIQLTVFAVPKEAWVCLTGGYMNLCVDKDLNFGWQLLHEAVCRQRPELWMIVTWNCV